MKAEVFYWKLFILKTSTEAYRKSGSQDPKLGARTQDPKVGPKVRARRTSFIYKKKLLKYHLRKSCILNLNKRSV